ncbi:MAG TPA: Holliday junction resolvase RuvX [Acidimicrobiia bacterium]|nr:Holliday junction resolvase RuvX [Acidimicrobiia bacterium]
MQRYISLDIGKKRTGVALVDDSARVATPLTVISAGTSSNEFLNELISLINEWEPTALIVGLPIDLKGREAVAAQDVRARTAALVDKINQNLVSRSRDVLDVHYVDERLTTAQAEQSMRDTEMSADQRKTYRDALAAAVIAQSFIDSL